MSREIETAAVAAGGGIVVWLGNLIWGRRKAKIDLLENTVDTMLKIIDGWKEYAESLQLRIKDLEKRVKEQDETIYNFTHGK